MDYFNIIIFILCVVSLISIIFFGIKSKLNKASLSNEDLFLKDALKGYIKYKNLGAQEQADAYRLLINRFTADKE